MICVPIKQKSFLQLLNKVKTAQKTADMVEIWFDEIEDLTAENLKKIFQIKKKPYLYKSLGDYGKIEKILICKPEYIDLDLSVQPNIIQRIKKNFPKTQIILSFHDFQKTPTENQLRKIIRKMQLKKADIVKIATTAKNFTDSLTMLSLLEKLQSEKQKAICLCMGKEGLITRTAGHLFGNYLMYAPLNSKEATAAGQITLPELKKILTNQ